MLLTALQVLLLGGMLAGCEQPPADDDMSTSGQTAKPSAKPTGSPKAPASSSKSTSSESTSAASAGKVKTKLVFVGVGQGDAIVIESGSWTGLVDGGPPGSADEIEAVLRKLDTKRLDALVVTHPHQDHIGGLPEIVSDYRPEAGPSAPGRWR